MSTPRTSLLRAFAAAGAAGCLALLLACGGAAAGGASASGNQAPSGTGTVTFVQLGDLHAHLAEHKDLVPDPSAPGGLRVAVLGGLARRATVVKRIRQSNPATLVMDVGDTFHGGVEALYTNGDAIVDPMNALGVDVGVPGNWDFAYGPIVTRQRYASLTPQEQALLAAMPGVANPATPAKRPNWTCQAANITYAMPAAKAGQPFLPPTLVRDLGGVRVGVIGISSDIVPRMSHVLAAGLTFLDGEPAYLDLIQRQAAALRARGVQLVVVLSHLGIHKDKQLADALPKGTVDVFFSGHTHEQTAAPLTSASGAWVVEAGHDASAGRMDITLAQGTIPGSSLQGLFEQQLTMVFSKDAFKQGGGWLEGYSGLDAVLDIAGPDGGRVGSLLLTGTTTPLAAAGTVSIAGCQRPNDGSDTLCSYTGFTGVAPLLDPKTGLPFNPVDFAAMALSQGLLKATTRHSLQDTSGLPVWPVNPFIQPLW